MANDHQAWLALTIEDPLDPDLPIIDPHHHLWDYPASRYLLGELLEDANSGHRIVQTVHVECMSGYRAQGPTALRPVGETEFICTVAHAGGQGRTGNTQVASGIVGFADLTLGEAVAPVLEAHIEAGDGRFRGIRHAVAWHADDSVHNAHSNPPQSLLLEPGFRRGFSCLRNYDLSFDAWLYHTQLAELAELAQAFPDTLIILNHVGSPLGVGPYAGRRTEVFEAWQTGMDLVAACDNVVVKLGGLGMKLCGFNWHKMEKPPSSQTLCNAMAPYFDYCLERFGTQRCMFESNFPVDRVSCSYTVLWNAFKRLARRFSDQERADLFHDTAARIYGLSD